MVSTILAAIGYGALCAVAFAVLILIDLHNRR